MDHKFFIKYDNIELMPLEKKHIEKLRVWRNDKDQTRYLKPIGYITKEMQCGWFDNYKKDKDIYTFVMYNTDIKDIIGSLSIYNFCNDCVEIGKIQIGYKQALGKGFASRSFAMLLKLVFEEFNLEKAIASVGIDNVAAQKAYFKLGFVKVGNINNFGLAEYKIEIAKNDLIKNIDYYEDIKIIYNKDE